MRKAMFFMESGAKSERKWKENKLGSLPEERFQIKEDAAGRSRKNREEARQFHSIFEPYLKEILSQFSLSE